MGSRRKQRRRTSSFGNVRQFRSGRWQVRYLAPDGTRVSAGTFATKLEAEAHLARIRTDIADKRWRDPDAGKEMFGAYAEQWIATRQVRGRPIRPRTAAHYHALLAEQLAPLARIRLDAISPARIRAWYARLDPERLTIRAHAYSLLASIMKTAVADELIDRSPCVLRGAGQASRAGTSRPATLAELAAIRAAMPERLAVMIDLGCWTALRFGEVTALTRADVDLELGTLRIERGVVRVPGAGAQFGDPKTDAGKRSVVIPPHIVPALAEHLDLHVGPELDALLFPGERSRYLAPSTFSGAYYPAREAAGRPDLRFHDLRHTGATLTAQTGATLAELMALLGQSSPQAAMRYQHAASDRMRDIAGAVSALATGEVVPIDRGKRARAR